MLSNDDGSCFRTIKVAAAVAVAAVPLTLGIFSRLRFSFTFPFCPSFWPTLSFSKVQKVHDFVKEIFLSEKKKNGNKISHFRHLHSAERVRLSYR